MSDVRLWTFANYQIRDILDVDLVSTTYRATTVDGDELCRLRVFTGDVQDGQLAEIHDAVIAEAQQARQIQHRNVLATLEAGRHGDRVYVVSTDVSGSVLREFIARQHPLKPRTVLDMGWQLAEALDEVHAAGMIHGSINPHTIWVADAPNTGRQVFTAYLTGFGSSLMLAQQVKAQRKAPVSDDLLYVGPDQMRQERASVEADRYALACAVYHLMTGKPPFVRDSINALFGAHLFSPVEPPSSIRRDLTPGLDSAFLRALAKDAGERYPSARALMVGIERALLGQTEGGTGRTRGPSDGAPSVRPSSPPPEPATPFLAATETAPPAPAAPDHGGATAADDVAAASATDAVDSAAADHETAGDQEVAARFRASFEAGSAAAQAGGPTSTTPLPSHDDDGRQVDDLVPPKVTTAETVTRVTARPGSAAARRPRARRHRLGTHGGMLVAMLAAVVAGAVATVVLATQFGDDPPQPAAQQQQAPPPNLAVRGGAEPTVVRPEWTTTMGSTPIARVARVEEAVLVSAETTVGALDPVDGEQLWVDDLNGAVRDIAVDDNVLVAGTDSRLTGYEVRSGEVLWTVSDDAGVDALARGRGEVFTARRAESGVDITRVDPDTGELTAAWTIDTGGPLPAGDDALALTFDRSTKEGGLILYLLTAENLYAFDPEVEDVVWLAPVDADKQLEEPRLAAEPWIESLGAIAGAVFVVGSDSQVCRYDGSTGEEVWTFCQPFSGQLDRAPVLYARRARVIVASTDAVTAYDFTNGLTRWGVTLADTLQPAVSGSSENVYVAREDGTLRALDHESGLEQWRAQDFGDITSMLADEGGVFVGRADGSVAYLRSRAVAGTAQR